MRYLKQSTRLATTAAATPNLNEASTPSTSSMTRTRWRRRLMTMTSAAAALSVLAIGVQPASAHTVFVFADPPGAEYQAYEGPGTNHRVSGRVVAGQRVAIACTNLGESVTGRYGATTVWDYIPRIGFVSDAYINTGQAGPVGPQCSSATGGHYDHAYLNSSGWDQAGLTLLCGELRSKPQTNPGNLNRCWGIYSDRPGLHREGRALDYRLNATVTAERVAGDYIAAYLKANANTYGVQEIIWNNRAWDVRVADWVPYDAVGQCGADTPTCRHEDHLHIGMNWAGAAAKTKRWEIVIDNYGIHNDRNSTRIEYSANWTGSSYDPGRYATGYRVATAQEGNDADNATFFFYLDPIEPKVKGLDAWWTSGTSRNSLVPIVVKNAQGQVLDRKFVDQKVNGGKFNSLGTYTFTEGWNSISVSRSTNPANGQHIVFDAVRLRGV